MYWTEPGKELQCGHYGSPGRDCSHLCRSQEGFPGEVTYLLSHEVKEVVFREGEWGREEHRKQRDPTSKHRRWERPGYPGESASGWVGFSLSTEWLRIWSVVFLSIPVSILLLGTFSATDSSYVIQGENIFIFSMLWWIGEEKQLQACRGNENIVVLWYCPWHCPESECRVAQDSPAGWLAATTVLVGYRFAQSSLDTESNFLFSRKCAWVTIIVGDPVYFVLEITWDLVFTWGTNNWGFECHLCIYKVIMLQLVS